MLPLSQIRRFAETVDAAGCSPAADRVAAAWGYPPGAARHCRTSANHVFTIGGTAYLRFLPAAYRDRDRVSRVAGLMRRLHDEGLPVAEPVPSTNGDLVETVSTDNGPVHAMLVQTAPGEQLDVDSLTPQRARAWGAALARLHRDCQYHDGLPDWFEDLAFDGDPALSTAIGALAGALSTLPRTRLGYGFCHGDFELDNMAWRGDTPVSYDFDEAGRSWFVADIASATRDLRPFAPGTARRGRTPAFDDFVAGYREVRTLPEAELDVLPLLDAAHAAGWLIRLRAVLDAGVPGDPDWLVALRNRLEEHAGHLRAMVLSALG